MKTNFKIVTLIIGILLLPVISYFTFIYFFTKEPKPIEVYKFSMSYGELEKRIRKEIEKEPKSYRKGDSIFDTRYITLGKDSAKYFFRTNLDENETSKYDESWIEFIGLTDSTYKMIRMSYNNKNEYPNRLRIFQDEFIKKIRKEEKNN